MPQNIIWNKKGIALNPYGNIHYIDHLAVVAVIMDIPLLSLDQQCHELAKRYYPGLQASLEEHHLFSAEFIFKKYDVSFTSDLWDRRTIKETFSPLEKKFNKIWRNVHVPHGFSDKGFYLVKSAMEDILLLYGQNMIDLLKSFGKWDDVNEYVITGNYRYSYFLKNAEFYQKIFEEEIQPHFDKKRPIILYAPTWVDFEQSSTFFHAYKFILDHLPSDFNMIVKLHPRLELDDVVSYHRIIGEYENRNNIFFLSEYPLVFPILANSDVYIGDMSSIGYDFLAFNRPLFLLNPQGRDKETDRRLFLFKCATEIKPDQYPHLYHIIEKEILHDNEKYHLLRKQMWNYTFGEQQRLFDDIKADIIRACE